MNNTVEQEATEEEEASPKDADQPAMEVKEKVDDEIKSVVIAKDPVVQKAIKEENIVVRLFISIYIYKFRSAVDEHFEGLCFICWYHRFSPSPAAPHVNPFGTAASYHSRQPARPMTRRISPQSN